MNTSLDYYHIKQKNGLFHIINFNADILLFQFNVHRDSVMLPKHCFVYLSGPLFQLLAQLMMCIWGGTTCLRTMKVFGKPIWKQIPIGATSKCIKAELQENMI